MKRTLKTIMAASVLALCLTGCEKEIFSSFSEIKFKAGTVAGPRTKTAYGTIVGSSDKVQMVDWRAGDLVRITSLQAAQDTTSRSIHYADYVVQSNGTPDAAVSYYSVSTISAQNRGLHWGDKALDHVFYSVYPSPGTSGKSSDDLDEYGAMQGNIPATQTPLSVSSSAPYVAAPNMIHQYMVAKRTVTAGKQKIEDGEVFLYYTPITTAIEFEVTNGMTDTLAISSIALISASHNLSGTFTASLENLNENGLYPNDTYPAFTAATGANKSASVSFGTTGFRLAKDQKLTFTIFLLPEDNLDDLTFRINKIDGKYIQAPLKSDATGNPFITFARCKKHFVKGLFVNEGATWVDFSAKVQSWKTGVADDADVYDQNTYVFEINGSEALQYLRFQNGAEAESKNLQIASYSYNPSDPTNKTAVSFSAYYSTNGGQTFYAFNAPSEDRAVNGLFGMKSSNNEGSATSKTYPITAVARELVNPGSHEYWVNGSTNASWSPNDWTSKGTIYLPYYNPKADVVNAWNSSRSSANCYIIRHSGRYVLPVIYGNAMSDCYYKPKALLYYSKESNSLQKAVNYLGREITSPFIDKDDGVAVAGCKILWQDVAGVITGIQYYDDIKKCVTSTATWNGYYLGDNEMAGLAFTVDPDKICQCNAVIGLVDADDNVIWSWHIWVTNDPALMHAPKSVYSSNEVEYKVFPMPALGTVSLSIYPSRPDLILKLKQNDSGIERLVTIYQVDLRESQRATYYQFGRKDPFYAGVTPQGGDRLMTVSSSPAANITEGIKHPNVFYSGSNWLSDGNRFINLWSGAYAAPGSEVDQQLTMHKTIYDPSPAGYMVPALNAFSTLSSYIGEFNLGYFFKLTGDDLDGTYFGTFGYLNSSGVLQESGTAGKYWSIIPDSLTSGGGLTIGSNPASPATLETGIPLGYGCLVRPVTDPNAKEL